MMVKLIQIGNSKGVRLPGRLLELYQLSAGTELEVVERADGILLRPVSNNTAKLSRAEAYRQMATEVAERTEWSDWTVVSGDGYVD
jgi:antitoxin component of MazEF toxin-antitoxin module